MRKKRPRHGSADALLAPVLGPGDHRIEIGRIRRGYSALFLRPDLLHRLDRFRRPHPPLKAGRIRRWPWSSHFVLVSSHPRFPNRKTVPGSPGSIEATSLAVWIRRSRLLNERHAVPSLMVFRSLGRLRPQNNKRVPFAFVSMAWADRPPSRETASCATRAEICECSGRPDRTSKTRAPQGARAKLRRPTSNNR